MPLTWNPSSADSPKYMPQLDALRAFAIAAVLAYHYSGMALGDRLAFMGGLGVDLFFTLSGFLITGILLRSRARSEASGLEKGRTLKRFYLRRSLRIFPLYYFVIAVAFVFRLPGVPPWNEVLGWLLTYTVNIGAGLKGSGFLHVFGHFWSLSVEEQFYLVWPWFVLFAPRKALIPGVVSMIALAPLYRWFAVAAGYGPDATYHFTVSCFDTLGMGSLLAMIHASGISASAVERFLRWIALPVGLTASVGFLLGATLGIPGPIAVAFYGLAHALFFVWLIHFSGKGFGGKFGAFLQLEPITYVGKISYGIYVYHPFIAYGVNHLLHQLWGASDRVISVLGPALCVPLVVLVSSASWFWLERPINAFKDRFSDDPRAQPARTHERDPGL